MGELIAHAGDIDPRELAMVGSAIGP